MPEENPTSGGRYYRDPKTGKLTPAEQPEPASSPKDKEPGK